MSSHFSPDPPNPRTWWSLPSKQSPHDIHKNSAFEKSSPRRKSSGLKVIATAIGFKSKKTSTQDPPNRATLPRISTQPIVDEIHLDRSSSKSLSSARTRVDSLEPTTPLDGQREGRQSLFTLSDVDPFALRGLSSPFSPSDATRLSVYSNPSIPDLHPKRAELPMFNRISYTSSNPHRRSGELSPVSLFEFAPKNPKPSKFGGSLHRKQSQGTQKRSPGNITQADVGKSTPFAMLKDRNRSSQPDLSQAPRFPMRPRGMTESGLSQRSGFLPKDTMPFKSSVLSSPRVIIRQPSASRIGLPPSAPPTQDLPSPPPQNRSHNPEPRTSLTSGSTSSSNISFISSGCHKDIHRSNHDAHPLESECPKNHTEADGFKVPLKFPQFSTSNCPLRKALSHQSLGKRSQSLNNPTSPVSADPTSDKFPRKQRPIHKHTLPPIPLPPRNTNTSASSAPADDGLPIVEQRRGSAGLTRRRLFSGSNSYRPSTSQSILSDDDTRSVFSVRSDTNHVGSSIFKPWARPLSPAPSPTSAVSPWEDELPPSSPSLASEYTPQQILSPDEMAQIEASVESCPPLGLSASTPDGDELFFGPPGPTPPTWKNSIDLPTRSNSSGTKGSPLSQRRPSTSQANMTVPFSVASPICNSPSSSSPVMLTSLPPPPRQPRSRPTFVTPPQTDDSYGMLPLPPPPRKHVRPKISIEQALQHRSIMRKPSFLEIDDESEEGDTDVENIRDPIGGSFLDLARESFDTTRHESE